MTRMTIEIALRRFTRSSLACGLIALVSGGCGAEPEPVGAPEPPPAPRETVPFEGEVGPPARTLQGDWYTIGVPEGTIPAVLGTPEMENVIDAIYPVDRDDHVSVTVWRPAPYQRDLDTFSADMIRIHEEGCTTLFDRTARIDGVAARLRGTTDGDYTKVSWHFVADGYGFLVDCTAEGTRDADALLARCAPLIATFRRTGPPTR